MLDEIFSLLPANTLSLNSSICRTRTYFSVACKTSARVPIEPSLRDFVTIWRAAIVRGLATLAEWTHLERSTSEHWQNRLKHSPTLGYVVFSHKLENCHWTKASENNSIIEQPMRRKRFSECSLVPIKPNCNRSDLIQIKSIETVTNPKWNLFGDQVGSMAYKLVSSAASPIGAVQYRQFSPRNIEDAC